MAIAKGLFDDPELGGLQSLNGRYRLEISAVLFENESDLEEVEFRIYLKRYLLSVELGIVAAGSGDSSVAKQWFIEVSD